MDRLIYLFGALLMSGGIVVLLGITPEVMTQDIMSLLSRQRSLKYLVAKAQGKVRRSRLQQAVMNVRSALTATHSENKFSLLISVSLIGICAGFLLAALLQNLLLIPIFSGICVILPYAYVNVLLSNYNRRISEELETALSVITTAYLRTEDIVTAVEENTAYLNPPVSRVFQDFLIQIKMVNPDVQAALRILRGRIDNEVFREWCDAVSDCQHDRSLKTTLPPIVSKLSDMRNVNAELEYMIAEPRKEFMIMVVFVVGNIPLMYLLNQDWYDVLMHTVLGQCFLAATAAAIFISAGFVVKLTRPIEYRR